MTVANLFAKHRSGEISKEKFLYEVRKDAQLPFISNLTSYDDAIKMLKQKGVIKEAKQVKESFIKELEVGDTYEYTMTPGDTLTINSINGDDMKVTTLQKGKKYNGEETKSWIEQALRMGLLKSTSGQVKEGINTTDKFDVILKNGEKYRNVTFIDYKSFQTEDGGMMMDQDIAGTRLSPEKQGGLSESKKSVKSAIKEQADLHLQIDRLNPILVKKAVNSELAKLPMIDAHTYQKMTEKVVKKLQKDPRAYDDVVVSNAKEINKIDDKNKMMPVKKELKDPHNQMKSPKGIEKPKANTKASKTENKKGAPKGVKEMKGSKKGHAGVKQMETPGTKETVLESLLSFMFKKKLNEDIHHEYGAGQGVDTPDGHGTIKDIIGSTITLEFQDGSQKDYQINQLNHFREEASKPINEPPPLEVKKDNPTMDEKKDAVIKKVMEFLGKKKKIKKEALTAKTGDSSHNQSVYNKINKIPGQARTDIKKAYDSGKTIDI